MALELLRYQPTTDGREGWRARIAELVAIANKDPALGGSLGAGEPDPAAGHRAPGVGDGKAAQAKKVVSCAASSPRGEPSCQIVQRTPEDARVSLERRRKNHDRAINDIGEAGKNVKVTGDPVYNPGCLALTRQQSYVVWPNMFKPDIGAHYDGTSNPVEFLQLYVVAIQAARGDQHAMANWFPMALKDTLRTCLMNLRHESVTSWKDLCRQFVANFMPTYERPTNKNDLKAVRQYKGETLRHYIQHFRWMRNKIPWISNEEVISAFSTGVADIKMREKLSVNDELTSVVRLFEIADRCTKAEEGRLFVHNLPEALPPKPKSKDPKRKEAVVLVAEPDHKQCHRDRSERDKGRRHHYCILHEKDTHNIDDCWVVWKFHEDNGVTKRRESSRSYSKGGSRGDRRNDDRDEGRRCDGLSCADSEPLPLSPPANDHREENQGAIKSREASPLASWVEPKLLHLIVTSSSCRERSRPHSPTSTTRLKWSTNKIGFDEEDHPISTKVVSTIPLLCTPTINNIAVNRTLIDGGAGLNIISRGLREDASVVPSAHANPTILWGNRGFYNAHWAGAPARHLQHKGQLQDRKP
jgi:hypothetical protein